MIISFSVENFKSFNDMQKFSMVANDEINSHPTHSFGEDVAILRNAAIFGANGSGKTNLIDAMKMTQVIIFDEVPNEARRMFCRTFPENENRATKFEFELLKNNKFYAYGFNINLKKKKILSEWIYQLYPNDGSQEMLFERELTGERVELGECLELSKKEQQSFETYKSDFGLKYDKLFLQEMNRNKNYDNTPAFMFFQEIYQWFYHDLTIIYPDDSAIDAQRFHDELDIQKTNDLIRLFDTGINEVNWVEISRADFENRIPIKVAADILDNLENSFYGNDNNPVRFSLRGGTDIFSLEKNTWDDLKIKILEFKHYGSESVYEISEESDGTRRLFELFEVILQKKENKVFIFDEINRSLHTNLLIRFLELFSESLSKQSIQLIFTTHDTRVLDERLLRRDEIWFVNRTAKNISKIYSLDEFKEIHSELPKDSYLLGRYGAIPLLKMEANSNVGRCI